MSNAPSRSSSPQLSSAMWRPAGPKSIDENLPPIRRVSLAGWLQIWRDLASLNRPQERDIFVLTSHFTDPETGERTRAQIDLSSCEPGENDIFYQTCDIDSVIGIVMKDFPIMSGAIIKYYMLQSITHTLTSNLHIPPVKIQAETGVKYVHMHKVPNARFLELEPRGLVRVFFPGLMEALQPSVCVPEDRLREFYDDGVHPAAIQVLPEELHRGFASSYDDDKFRADTSKPGKQGRSLQHSARDIHADYLNGWVGRIRELVDNCARLRWAQGFFFGVEMRGLKNREDSLHPPPEGPLVDDAGNVEDGDHPRITAVDAIFKDFNTDLFEDGHWVLDIATTISVSEDADLPSVCAFASADKHAHMISHFTDLPWVDCVRYAAGEGGYYEKDEVAQLNGLAGFRFTNPWPEASGVHYLQVYSTDKSVIYNVDMVHNAQRTTAKRLLESWDSEVNTHIVPLLELFRRAKSDQGVALRVESRVDFFQYPNVHTLMKEHTLRRFLLRIARRDFWCWKYCRLLTYLSVLTQWMNARSTFLSHRLPEIGTALITLTWMMNGLVNRPDSGGTWDEVRDVACVHVLKSGVLVPVRPLGALFVPAIRFVAGRQPRSSSQRTLSIDTICYLIGSAQEPVNEIQLWFKITGKVHKPKRQLERDPWSEDVGVLRGVPAPRVGNKQRQVHIMTKETPDNGFADVLQDAERERYSSEDEDPEEREATMPTGQKLTNLLHSYPVQMFAKAPNRAKSSESWCRLDPKRRSELTFDIFSSMSGLQDAFESYMLFVCECTKWDQTVRALIPDIEEWEKTRDWQGLPALTARDQFVELLRSQPEQNRPAIVARAREYVNDRWLWLPFGPGKKHMWSTGKANLPKSATQFGPVVGGPWIVLNPARTIR